MSSAQSGPPLSASNAKLVEQYRRNYPNHPDYTPFTVSFTAQPEFNAYTGIKVDKSETLKYLGPILFENFFKHLLKYQRKLEVAAKVVYDEHQRGVAQRLYEEFDKETTIKSEIIKSIRSCPEFSSSSSSASKTPRRQLFLNSRTELQLILSPAFHFKSVSAHTNLNDPWNPIHVMLSFPLFCRVVNTQVHSDRGVDTMVLKKHNRHDGTYKRKYIQHMQTAAESDHEFLLAIVSAFGTDPRLYPSAVLTMMETRNMLNVHDSKKGVSAPISLPAPADVPIGTKHVKELPRPSTPNSILISHAPIMPFPPSSTQSTSSVVVTTQKQTEPLPTTEKEPATISRDEFNNCVKKTWILFHGEKNPLPIPSNWYENFAPGFPEPNDRNGILSNCVKVLLWDLGLNEWEPGCYKIARLESTFPTEFKGIKESLENALRKSPSVTPTPDTGFGIVMENNSSLLQQALVQSRKMENGNSMNSSIPHPGEWSPSLSLLPFAAFQAHAHWLMKTKIKAAADRKLEDLDVEIMKFHFVEFLVLLFRQNPRQLVLSIFTAYGPNVLNYPIRVLQILKKQELLQPGTTLHDFIGSLTFSQDLYEMIFEGDSGVPFPIELQIQPEQVPSPTPSPPVQSATTVVSGVGAPKCPPGPTVNPFPEKVRVNGQDTKAIPSTSTSLSLKSVAVPVPLKPPVNKPSGIGINKKDADPKTISMEEFFRTGRACWNMFYGETTTKPMPPEWYGFFKSQFPHVNNVNGILDNCIQVMLKDKAKIGKGIPYKIHRLLDQFPAEFKSIEKNLCDSIPKYPEVVSSARTGLETVMLNKKSVLQHALIEPPKLDMVSTATAYNEQKARSVPPPTDWCPSFSVLPFHGFQAHIHWYMKQKMGGDLEGIDEEVLRLRYVEYLFIRGRKVPQYLIGMLTAYGPNVLQYPIRILQLLKEAELLRPETKLYRAIGSTNISKDIYYNIFDSGPTTQSITKELNSKTEVKGPHYSTLTSTPSSSSSSLSSFPHKEVREQPVDRNVTPELKSSDPVSLPNFQVSPFPSPSTELLTLNAADEEMPTIPAEEFFNSVQSCWNNFYGEGTKKVMPVNWYSRYKSQYPEPNNKDGILGSCIANLVRNHDKIKKGAPYKICCLPDIVSDSKLKRIEEDLVEAQHRPVMVYKPGDSCDTLMWNEMSFLQAALVAPVEMQTAKGTPTKKSVTDVSNFQPTDWCPSRSVFPFPAFVAHVQWYLGQNFNVGDIHGLDMEIMKLRFVEYFHQFMYNTNQFLLALFTAYGPNVLQYPVRILQILKQRRLLRPGTKLFDVVELEMSAKVYSSIFDNMVSSLSQIELTSPPTKVQVPVEKKSSVPLPTPPGGDGGAGDQEVPNSSTLSFDTWRAECEKALEELAQHGSVRYRIPDAYYQELFESYRKLTQNQTDGNAFLLFILGVWTGSRLAGFQLEPPAPPPSKQSEPIPTSSSPSTSRNNLETEVGQGGVVACRHSTDEGLHLDEGGVRVLRALGVTPLDSIASIHNTFVSMKKFELETLEKIVDEFPGEQIQQFVRELSFRICWVADDEDMKITALLISGLISKKLISKAYTIHSIRNGVIKNLPEILVKVLHVNARVASFLAHLFLAEEDFCWFLTLTDELRRDYLPVWVDLTKKTVEALRRRSTNGTVMEMFARTPGAEGILQSI